MLEFFVVALLALVLGVGVCYPAGKLSTGAKPWLQIVSSLALMWLAGFGLLQIAVTMIRSLAIGDVAP